MKYERTYKSVPVSDNPEVMALVDSEEHAVPVLHAPKNRRAHPAGLGVFLGQNDDEGWNPRLEMEIAPAAERPGEVEPGPRGGVGRFPAPSSYWSPVGEA